MKYLAIKNWRKFQTIEDDLGRVPWIKDYVDKDSDIDRMKLTGFCTNILDRLYRLRARTGRILHNDITWITDAIHTHRTDRPHIKHAIDTLISRNFIFPTDDENFEASAAVEVEVRKRKDRGNGEREKAASLKKEKTNPVEALGVKAEEKPNPKKDCGCGDGLCDWSEPIPACAHPSSVGDAVYYQRHVKRNQYFIDKLSRGYVLNQWQRLLNDTPEDFTYDPDPMIKERRIHVDGDDQPTVIKEVVRRPKNAAERSLLLKDPDWNRKWLFDPACSHGCKEGSISVLDYPGDPALGKFEHAELCQCVTREEHMEAKA